MKEDSSPRGTSPVGSADRDPDQPSYGVVPKRRRPLLAWSLTAVGLVSLLIGVVIGVTTHQPINWGLLLASVGFVVSWYGFYLWIRLSD